VALERFFRRRGPTRAQQDDSLPDLWSKCPKCGANVYNKNLEANWRVCPECGHHHRLPVSRRLELLADPGSFVQTSGAVRSTDPLEFVDTEAYPARLARSRQKTGRDSAILAGRATMGGQAVVLVMMDFEFSGGSLGSAEGEEIARAAELAATEGRALVLVAASGGARMQESALSLMQMAKTTVALEGLAQRGLPYLSLLTDPTTGGVTASYATIADVVLAEPGALIGFAGQRVIQQTIRQNLPDGFQRAEFYEQRGMIDRVLPRSGQREAIARLIALLRNHPAPSFDLPTETESAQADASQDPNPPKKRRFWER
jgi:acetyl-CoA carboxylase carboxyl transferase subunit beta